MYFLLDACQHPGILRTIYFITLLEDIVFTVLPIGLVLFLMIDFSKATIANKEEEQIKNAKLVPKRIIYAIIVFIIPWIVGILMDVLDSVGVGLAEDFNTCIDTAKAAGKNGDFSYYDELLKVEEEKELQEFMAARDKDFEASGPIDGGNNSNPRPLNPNNISDFSSINVLQCNQSWSSHPLCTNKKRGGNDDRTICSSGCGFSSMTTILRTLGYTSLEPSTVVDKVCSMGAGTSGYATPSDFVKIANDYGLKTKVWGSINSAQTASQTFTPLLKEGKKLIVNMPGHYISILGIQDNGNIIVGDSARGYETGGRKGGPYTVETLFKATITSKSPYWLNVTAIWK